MTIEPQMLSQLIDGFQRQGATFVFDDYALRKLAWRLDHLIVSADRLEAYLDTLSARLGPIDKKIRADELGGRRRDYLVPLADDIVDKILERPLWSRHASELRPLRLPQIAINPVALMQLQEELSEEANETWDHLIEEEEQRLCRANGLSFLTDDEEAVEETLTKRGPLINRPVLGGEAPQRAELRSLPISAGQDGIAWIGDTDEQTLPADGIKADLADPQHYRFNLKPARSPAILQFESSGVLPDRPLLIEAQPGLSDSRTFILLLRLGGIGYALAGTRATLRVHAEDGQPLSNAVALSAQEEDPIFILQWRGKATRPVFPGDRLEIAFDSAGQQTYHFSCTVEL